MGDRAKALAQADPAKAEIIKKLFDDKREKRARHDADILAAQHIASYIDDDGNWLDPLMAAKFTVRQYRMAKDARLRKRDVPVYMQHAQERELVRARNEGDKARGGGVTILINNAPAGASPAYAVVELTKDGKHINGDDK